MINYLGKNTPPAADLIFVLAGRAGRENRKLYGLQLFHQGLAPRILFSVSRFEIRPFSKMSLPVPLDLLKLAADVQPPLRHFFVSFTCETVEVKYVRPRRFGTLTEIESLRRWLEGRLEIESLLVISNRAHLPRIGMCCRSLLSDRVNITLVAAPDMLPDKRIGRQFTAALIELWKILIYWLVLVLRRNPPFSNR